MEFRLETEVGRDVTFADLLGEFDAVFLGVGTCKYMKGGFANEEAPGSMTPCPTSSPTPIACWAFEKAQADYIDFAGKQVVVLGAATPPWTACAPPSARVPIG